MGALFEAHKLKQAPSHVGPGALSEPDGRPEGLHQGFVGLGFRV